MPRKSVPLEGKTRATAEGLLKRLIKRTRSDKIALRALELLLVAEGKLAYQAMSKPIKAIQPGELQHLIKLENQQVANQSLLTAPNEATIPNELSSMATLLSEEPKEPKESVSL